MAGWTEAAPVSVGVPGSALCTVVMVVGRPAVASTSSPLSVQSLLRPGEDTS